MRLFHTSDWHLGQNLHGQERDFEHACFLDWLLRQLAQHTPDVLLIAGDIFDTVNPPVKAQERLYDFIVSAHEQQPLLTIVMIAGNHDSGSRIELPAPLMRRLRTHALGRVLWLDDGQLDAERLLIPLPDASGGIVGWCLALPFLRPAEVTGAHLGDNYLRGIGQVHEWLIAAANAKRQPGQALIAISHAHMAGGSVSEDSERSLIIGNAEALPASLFGPSISYVALGHLHKPQKVNGEERIRYSGSPIPLSFSEIGYQHQILDIELEGETLLRVEPRLIPAPSTCNAWAPRRWPRSWGNWLSCRISTCWPISIANPGWKCGCASTSRNRICASKWRPRCKARLCVWYGSPPNTLATATARAAMMASS